jgi:hypothetical protein
MMFQDPQRFSVLMRSTHVPAKGLTGARVVEKQLIGEAEKRPLQGWERSRLGPDPDEAKAKG